MIKAQGKSKNKKTRMAQRGLVFIQKLYKIENRCEITIRVYTESLGCDVVEINVQADHVHLLVNVPPKISISRLLGTVKGKTALQIFKQFPSYSFKNSNPGIAEVETAIELAYYAQITPWFAVKPDIQWIKNPGMITNKAKATIVGIRLELSL